MKGVTILRRTTHFIVLNKPALIFSQPAEVPLQHTDRRPLLDILKKHHPEFYPEKPVPPYVWPKLVHRLDYGVSGAMVVGLTNHAVQKFHRNFKEGGNCGWPLRKLYLAVVKPRRNGMLSALIENTKDPSSTVALPETITEWDPAKKFGRIESAVVDEENKRRESATEFTILNTSPRGGPPGDEVLLALNPISGRKHQLRIHCSHVLGAPIVNDLRYGFDEISTQRFRSRQIALHSWRFEYKPALKWERVYAPIVEGIEAGAVWHNIDLENFEEPPLQTPQLNSK
ncbi:pseudouridine synthase [Myxozyma melibiosi]|uniref:21S rRNA pseudouridine(2819) synthase n=1 Tax=Myxozyma melibiosi TaxID=54550 RepID=A0ABR1FBU1_9ASCO